MLPCNFLTALWYSGSDFLLSTSARKVFCANVRRRLFSGPENYFWFETVMHPPVGALLWSSGNVWCREGTGTLDFLVCERLVRKVVSDRDGNRSVLLRHPLLRLVDQHKARGRNRRECKVRFWPSSFILRLSGRSKSGPCVISEGKFFET